MRQNKLLAVKVLLKPQKKKEEKKGKETHYIEQNVRNALH